MIPNRALTSWPGLGTVLLFVLSAAPALPDERSDLFDLARSEANVLRFSTLFTAQNVRDHLANAQGIDEAIWWCRDTAVTHVYLESFRDGYTADRDTLAEAKRRFTAAGFLVSGCITTTGLGRKAERGWLFPCFTDQASLERLEKESRYAAGLFDEIMIDDFFATKCECDACVRARGERSWSAFRCDLLRDVSRRRLLEPAREVNPAVKVIIKYPQWYEDFHERGYDVTGQTAMFDRIWVGTETRDPDSERWGKKSQYEAYFIMRWLGGIGGEKCGGGWFDPYGTTPPTYLEQARQTVLAGAREALLFCYGALHRGTGPANVAALRGELPGLFELARLVRHREPRGIAAPRPPSSDAGGDRFVYDFIGLLGLPLVPDVELRDDVPAAFLSAHLRAEPGLRPHLDRLLAAGTPLLVTDHLARALGWNESAPDSVRILAVPDDPWKLVDIAVDDLRTLRRKLLEPLGVQLDAPARVALALLGDDVAVIQNFADAASEVTLSLAGRPRAELTLVLPSAPVKVREDRGATRLTLPPRSLAALRFTVKRTAGSTALLAPDAGLEAADIVPQDARASFVDREGHRGLRVRTGTRERWPGVTVKAPGGRWDLSSRAWLSADVTNRGDASVRVHCRVDNPGADGRRNCLTESVDLAPGRRGTIVVALSPRLVAPGEIEFFGMRGAPPVTSELDPANVTQLVFFVSDPSEEHLFTIDDVRAGGHREPLDSIQPDHFFPMIDELGQYSHGDWPGKTYSVTELREAGRSEEKELAVSSGPSDRDRWGGWAGGPQLAVTGFFRVEKVRGAWWLVDPDGRLFWSHGIDCVHASASTPISDREHWFRGLPKPGDPGAAFYGTGTWAPHGYYERRTPYRTYDFFRANQLLKHGEGWEERFADLTHRRLRSWGLNTIGNWSERSVYERRRTPYTVNISSGRSARIEGSKGYWGKFPDVFDASFAASLRERLGREVGRSAGDPWCIGYFIDNELGWGDELSLAEAALTSPPEQAAKQVFVDVLKESYGDSIAKLNEAWGTTHASWDVILAGRDPPDRERAAVKDDLRSFYTTIAETYFRTVREAVREAAPNQLYLGCRFAWVNERAARAASKFCDIVCYNRYTYSVAEHRLPEGIDRPTIIGEFHFGALDRGLFHTGLRKARDQEHRAELYREYVLGALRNPQIVGTHWFQYKDQAVTGRGDGENYQIGFVDVCDRPYPEIIRACREVGERMYETRYGTPE